MSKNIIVISDNKNSSLARKISLNLHIPYKKIELRIFADGESKIILGNVTGKNCIIVHSTYPPTDQHLMQLFMIIYKCKKDGANDICVVCPYLAYARQDKVFVDGEIISIDLIAKILASIGITQLITIDAHNPRIFNYNFITKNLTAIPFLANYVLQNIKLNNPVVISPDKGGIERAKEFAEYIKASTLSLIKTRNRFTGDVSVTLDKQYSLAKRDALIIDDMISTGNSIIKVTKLLKKNNIGNIYAICTHAILIDNAKEKLLNTGIKEIISTNSIPNESIKVDLSNLISNHFLS